MTVISRTILKTLTPLAVAAAAAIAATPAFAGDIALTPGSTYDVSAAAAGSSIVVDAPGTYTLSGSTTVASVEVRCTGVTLQLADGLSIAPGDQAGAAVPAIKLCEESGDIRINTKAGATATLKGNGSAAILKVGDTSRLTLGTEDASRPGTINATGGKSAAGIGSAASGSGTAGNIVIEAGCVNATGGEGGIGDNVDGAGIGGGAKQACGDITITGGTVNASSRGIAIGGEDAGLIRISGGTVTATVTKGRSSHPAIGATASLEGVKISGGTVTATGYGIYSSGIGVGKDGSYNISISGGTVNATGGDGYYVELGGTVVPGGPGIGAPGEKASGNIYISGGTITATAGYRQRYDIGAEASNDSKPAIQITGGSLYAKSAGNAVNESGTALNMTSVALDGASESAAVSAATISGLGYAYALDDVRLVQGNMYLWLPVGAAVTDATADGSTYKGSVAAGASGTLSAGGSAGEDDSDTPSPAAKGTKLTVGKFVYKVVSAGESPTVALVAYKGTGKTTVKSSVNVDGVAYKVTSVAATAFCNNKKLTQVTVAKGVSTVCGTAFKGCAKLKKLILPKATKLTAQGKLPKTCKVVRK